VGAALPGVGLHHRFFDDAFGRFCALTFTGLNISM